MQDILLGMSMVIMPTYTLCFCYYHKYCLEDSSGDKSSLSDILMHYEAKKPRSTLIVYGIAKNCRTVVYCT